MGNFEIKNDSIYFYHGEKAKEELYTAKILFTGENKLVFLDGNGESDFVRRE